MSRAFCSSFEMCVITLMTVVPAAITLRSKALICA